MATTRRAAMVCVLLLACGAAAGQPLADKVPDSALIYVGWAGRSLTFDGSTFGQLLNEPFVKEIVTALEKASTTAAGNEDDRAIVKHLWAMGSLAWKHPAALSVYSITPPAGEGKEGPKEPAPTGAVIVDLQKDRAAFAVEFQGLLAAAGKKLKITQAAVGEVTYSRFDTPGGPCGMGFVGDLFFMALGEKAPETVAAMAAGKTPALSAKPAFAAAMKEVAGEAVQVAWYVDVAAAVKTAEQFAPPAPEPGKPAPLKQALDALGLDRATAMVGATNIVDRGFLEKTRLLSPEPHRGVLALLAGGAPPATALSGVPADADLFVSARLDPSKLLAEIRRSLTAADPKLVEQFDSNLKAAGEQFGLDVEKDLLAALGDQWTFVSAPSLGGPLTGTAVMIDLKDPAKAAGAIAKLEAALDKILTRPPTEYRPTAGGMAVQTSKSGDLTVRFLAAIGKGDPWPVAPAWAIQKDRLIIAAWPQVVVAAAEKPAKLLTDQPGFAALRKRVSPNASILTYTNDPALLQRFYGLGMIAWTMAGNALAGEVGPVLSPAQLPPLSRLTRYTSESISAVSSDAKGITIEAYGGMPGGGLMGSLLMTSPMQWLGVAAAMPALGQARGQARGAVVSSELRMIGQACMMYATDHQDRMPPDLESLVETKAVTEEFLKRDRGGKIVYLGATMKLSGVESPSETILAYFLPDAGAGEAVTVLHFDGSVTRVPQDRFQQELAKTQKLITPSRKRGTGIEP